MTNYGTSYVNTVTLSNTWICMTKIQAVRNLMEKARIGSLNSFNRLSTLEIQPRMLLRGSNEILKASHLLRDVLPPSLQSLTLYDCLAADGLINSKNLQMELYQMLKDSTLFSNLRFLIIEDTYNDFLRRNATPGSEIFERLNALQQACMERDIIFRIMSPNYLPWGGSNLLKTSEASDPEKRAHDAWKRGLDGLRAETPERVIIRLHQ